MSLDDNELARTRREANDALTELMIFRRTISDVLNLTIIDHGEHLADLRTCVREIERLQANQTEREWRVTVDRPWSPTKQTWIAKSFSQGEADVRSVRERYGREGMGETVIAKLEYRLTSEWKEFPIT